MPTLHWVLFGALIAFFVIWFIKERVAAYRRLERLRRIPLSRIAGIPERRIARFAGEVKRHVIWRVAPLSRRPCVYWRVRVFQEIWRGRRLYLELVVDACSDVPFVVDDGSGRALLNPRGADVWVKPSPARRARPGKVNDHERAWLAEQGYAPGRCTLVFQESVILIGQELSVVGAGRCEPVNPEDPGTYRHLPAHWLHLDVTMTPDLAISDHPALLRRGYSPPHAPPALPRAADDRVRPQATRPGDGPARHRDRAAAG